MSDGERDMEQGHPRDDLAVYALGALPADEAAAVEAHLAGCEQCRERLLWLSPAVDQIPAGVEQRKAPPELRERLMAIVDAEAEVPRETVASGPAKGTGERRRWLPRFDALSLRPALAGLAVVLLLVAGVVGYELHDDGDGSDTRAYTAQAAQGFAATGTLEVEGDKGTLSVADMPATHGGDVYQAWIEDERGMVQPSSVFVTSDDGSGTVTIPHGLDDAVEVMVTRESRGGSEVPTESPFLSAQLD